MSIKTKFILTSILIFGGIIILKYTLPQKINEYKTKKEFFWVEKTHSNKKADIVIAGDSRVYRGFSTQDFIKELNTNYTALNLGYSSAGYGQNYLILLIKI